MPTSSHSAVATSPASQPVTFPHGKTDGRAPSRTRYGVPFLARPGHAEHCDFHGSEIRSATIRSRRPTIQFVVLGAASLAFAIGGCRSDKPESSTAADLQAGRWNVILISLDTLRADRLGCYGYARDTTPSIDALASQGVRFANVVSETSWTLPSHMTMFTGLYPTTHGVTAPGTVLTDDVMTLAERFKEHAYRTFAYTGGGFVDRQFGFDRGFEEYHGNGLHGLEGALEMARRRIETLDEGERHFIFIHAYDIHAPYTDQEPYASMFQSPDAESPTDAGWNFGTTLRHAIELKEEGRRLSPGNIRYLSDRYDGGIRRADDLVGRFLAFLKQRGAFENTIIVLLSDHGEEFGEHGWVGHTGTMYPECLHPPMIIFVPGGQPTVVSTGVGLMDLTPTLLDLVGLPAIPCQGRSLVAMMRGESMAPRPLLSEIDYTAHYRSVIWNGWQLIRKPYSNTHRLFNLKADPTAQTDLAESFPETVSAMLEVMPNPPTGTEALKTVYDLDVDLLRSLGYIGSAE